MTNELIVVTGAGGHLGANLVRHLHNDGARVRALLHSPRDERAVAGLGIETMIGDLCDPAFVAAAVQDCTHVHHCAAKVSTNYRGDQQALFDCNVLATRNLLDACLHAGVNKVVVTSSFSAVGRNDDGSPSDETMPFNPLQQHLPYAHTKAAVEHECLKAVTAGLPVVIAVSTAILGPNDFKPSRMGQVLQRFAMGRLHAYSPGGFEFVAARDIAEGHVLTMERGEPGEKYIFASGYRSFDEIMRLFAQVTGNSRLPMAIPPWVMSVLATTAAAIMPIVAPHSEQLLTPAAVRILQMQRRADISKARTMLSFQPTPIEDAVQEAYDCFVRRGVITPPTVIAPRRASQTQVSA